MKEDFVVIKRQLPGICQVAADFYLMPKRRGSYYFVKSPATDDKTWSLCLYQDSSRFVDYANGNYNGDAIGFVSYVRNVSQWEALQILKNFYGLSDSNRPCREDRLHKIRLQQERERKASERRTEFQTALSDCITDLKEWRDIYRSAIEKRMFEPFDEMWSFCVNELQKTEYSLDILCCADCRAYPRLKPNPDAGLPNDRFQWILDSLAILEDYGYFKATDAEKKEISEQRDFELTRKPGVDRRSNVAW